MQPTQPLIQWALGPIWAECEADCSHASDNEFKNECNYTCNYSCSVVIMLYCYCVALLLFVLSYVLIVCTVPLPPGVNPIAVDKYIYLSIPLLPLYAFMAWTGNTLTFYLYLCLYLYPGAYLDLGRLGSCLGR